MTLIAFKRNLILFFCALALSSFFTFAYAKNKVSTIKMADYFKPSLQIQIDNQDPTSFSWLIRQAKISDRYFSKLAYWYEAALGGLTKPDYEKAFRWYLKAAEQTNDSFAQYKLGEFYEKGIFVAHDSKRSFHWYDQSAINSYPLALRKMGDIYKNGNDYIEPNAEKARRYYETSAAMEDDISQYEAASMYQMPPFLIGNKLISIDWYLKLLANPNLNKPPIYENKAQLLARKKCLSSLNTNITVVVSQSFVCANRGNIKRVIKYLGVKPIDSNRNSELFKTSDIHSFGSTFVYDFKKGEKVSKDINSLLATSSSVMKFSYSGNQLLESITYLFPAIAYKPKKDFFLANKIVPDDRLKAVEIKNQFAAIYGPPQLSQESISTVLYRWLFADGIVLQIYRKLPSTYTFVSFYNPVVQQIRIKKDLAVQQKIEENNKRINQAIKKDRKKILSRFSNLLNLENKSFVIKK